VRLKLLPQARSVARGNPGLQELIGQKLVLSTEVPRARAEAALKQMEDWLDGGDLPEEAEVRTFLEDLTIDTLLDLAGASGRDLLSAIVTIDLPVPVAVVEVVANELGGAPLRLCDLGLLDVFEDLVDHREPALAPRVCPCRPERCASRSPSLLCRGCSPNGVDGRARQSLTTS
jgi:hypothetical protein